MTAKKPRSSPSWLSRAEFQRALGQSRAEVDKLLAQGLPHETVGSGRGATIRINRDAALAWLAGQRKGRKSQAPTGPPAPPGPLILEQIPGRVPGAMVITALEAIYSSTWFAHHMATVHGCTEEQASNVSTGVSLMLATHFEVMFRDVGIEPFKKPDPEWLEIEQFWWMPKRGLRADLSVPGVPNCPPAT